MASLSSEIEKKTSSLKTKPELALDHTLDLIMAKDDTSRFAGLSALRFVLDRYGNLKEDPRTIKRCWEAIPIKFLIRLLRSTTKSSNSDDDTASMMNLAVAIIYHFMTLLPAEDMEEDRSLKAGLGILSILPHCSGDVLEQGLRSLVTISSYRKGAEALLTAPSDELQFILDNITTASSMLSIVMEKLLVMPTDGTPNLPDDLVRRTRDAWVMLLLAYSEHFLSESKENREIKTKSLDLLGTAVMNNPNKVALMDRAQIFTFTRRVRRAFISAPLPNICQLVAKLFHWIILARSDFDPFFLKEVEDIDFEGTKPFVYQFMNMILINIRTTIPSLMEQLAAPDYRETAATLVAEYDISTKFLIVLLNLADTLDDEGKLPNPSILISLKIAPDQLLKLKADISETISLTCEHIRDRWDAAFGGAPGLHPGAKVDRNQPLPITWENPEISTSNDPMITAGLRMLATYIGDDHDKQLIEEACGITDVLLSLYASSLDPETLTGENTDLRSVLLVALEVLVYEEYGSNVFQEQDGFPLLVKELRESFLPRICRYEEFPGHLVNVPEVLHAFVASSFIPLIRESWIREISNIALEAYKYFEVDRQSRLYFDTCINISRLLLALYEKAPYNLRGPYRDIMLEIGKVLDAAINKHLSLFEEEIVVGMFDVQRKIRSMDRDTMYL